MVPVGRPRPLTRAELRPSAVLRCSTNRETSAAIHRGARNCSRPPWFRYLRRVSKRAEATGRTRPMAAAYRPLSTLTCGLLGARAYKPPAIHPELNGRRHCPAGGGTSLAALFTGQRAYLRAPSSPARKGWGSRGCVEPGGAVLRSSTAEPATRSFFLARRRIAGCSCQARRPGRRSRPRSLQQQT